VRAGFYFANRFSDGLTNGMYATVRSAITDISPKERLFQNLGIEGAIVSLGFVLGPMAAGLVLTVFEVPLAAQARTVASLAVGLSGLNVLLSLGLRETHHQRSAVRGAELRAEVGRSINVLTLWARLRTLDLALPGLRRVVLTQVALTLSTGYYFYFVAYASLGDLHLDARALSYYFIFFGCLSIFINYVFYTHLADRLPPRRTIFWLSLAGVPILASYGVIGSSILALAILTVLDCLSISLIQGLLEGLLAQRTTDTNRGEVFGLNQAMQGLASIVTTLVFGVLSLVDLRLPFAWFGLCLGGVVWLTRPEKPPQ
jgi:DHA1 family tetracycline resistance protein-like MFS transporter